MNDGIMNTWDVVSSDHGAVMFRCAKHSTAEYLRDWCEAEEWNLFLNTSKRLYGVYPHVIPLMEKRIDTYSVTESEVIL
jgi:hypothetical protein